MRSRIRARREFVKRRKVRGVAAWPSLSRRRATMARMDDTTVTALEPGLLRAVRDAVLGTPSMMSYKSGSRAVVGALWHSATPNYSVNHARSRSNSCLASTAPLADFDLAALGAILTH